MRRTQRMVALTTVLAAATAPLLAIASPAAAAPAKATTQTAQNLPLDWLTLDALSGSQLLQRVKGLLSKGYVPSALSVSNAANPQYTSVWIKDTTRKVNVLQGLSTTNLQKTISDQLKAGFQPAMITGTGTGANAVFGAVFEKTTEQVKSQLGLTKETFAKVNAEFAAAGYSVASLDVYGTVERPLYAAVWVAGAATGTVQVTLGQTVEQRGQELLAKAKQGLRPVLMAVEPGKLYTTVWSKGSATGLKEYLNLSRLTYTLKATQMKALGYKPTILDTEGGVFAAIWSKS
ncbi:hypothetical protein ETD86_00525 [Nonomuraea turkmeniaca]|uniref:Uncharacterized protein n=1 Tax=Nonomuraea turkmeniaca TaxID=103838 RepID=A0A5S4FY57_9ACTN|nr:hypothetical protein [Nonomuraea turkmeniaca]TMR25646.1 hypothetical protein ETD86_00525 [Nonomuraea turkmeniaca]